MWPDEAKTERLLAGARQGDERAVENLLDRHRRALRRLAHVRLDPGLHGRVDASDVLQDAYLTAAQRLPQYLESEGLPFHLWLRQLVMDAVIDAHRRHRLAKKRSVDREVRGSSGEFRSLSSLDLVAGLRDDTATPGGRAVRRELRIRCEGAFDLLGAEDREILLLRHVEQLSNRDAAMVLNLGEPAAAMRYLRALRRLRGLLARDGDSETGS